MQQFAPVAIQMVETGGHVAAHFNMLHLVAAYGHFVGGEHQNVGGHEYGVHEKPSRDALIRLAPGESASRTHKISFF